ncbi:MAG TPA: universal stress protein [Candidatus Nitrosotenuis sp.]|nr:universal stress protein [Candidatus Nitrosotenuis sp.]
MYSKILVPLDGSELSEIALQHAEELASRFGSELILLRGLPPPDPVREARGQPQEDQESLQAEVAAYLEKICQRLAARGLRARSVSPRQDPAAAIVGTAQDEGVDLILMASYSQSEWDRWIHGSVPGKVLRRARCPFLLIRAEAPQEPAEG